MSLTWMLAIGPVVALIVAAAVGISLSGTSPTGAALASAIVGPGVAVAVAASVTRWPRAVALGYRSLARHRAARRAWRGARRLELDSLRAALAEDPAAVVAAGAGLVEAVSRGAADAASTRVCGVREAACEVLVEARRAVARVRHQRHQWSPHHLTLAAGWLDAVRALSLDATEALASDPWLALGSASPSQLVAWGFDDDARAAAARAFDAPRSPIPSAGEVWGIAWDYEARHIEQRRWRDLVRRAKAGQLQISPPGEAAVGMATAHGEPSALPMARRAERLWVVSLLARAAAHGTAGPGGARP